jgi:hypothetical protein
MQSCMVVNFSEIVNMNIELLCLHLKKFLEDKLFTCTSTQ